MGNYQGRVKNSLRSDDPEPIERDGLAFHSMLTNLCRWYGWWRVVQLEHLLTFVFGLFLVASVLMNVAIRYASGSTANAVQMWSGDVVPLLDPAGSFLVSPVLFAALFTTEYAIIELFVRNSTDVLYESYGREAGRGLPKPFWRLLTASCVWGVVIILLFSSPSEDQEPFLSLVTGAAMSDVMMWPYTAFVLMTNTTRFPEHIQPGWVHVVGMWWATDFYGYFNVLLIGTWLNGLGVATLRTVPTVIRSRAGGYLLWADYFVVQVYAMVKSAVGKCEAAGTIANADEAVSRFS